MPSVYNLFHIKISQFSLLFIFGENSLLIENLLALNPFTISLQGVYFFMGLTTSSVCSWFYPVVPDTVTQPTVKKQLIAKQTQKPGLSDCTVEAVSLPTGGGRNIQCKANIYYNNNV